MYIDAVRSGHLSSSHPLHNENNYGCNNYYVYIAKCDLSGYTNCLMCFCILSMLVLICLVIPCPHVACMSDIVVIVSVSVLVNLSMCNVSRYGSWCVFVCVCVLPTGSHRQLSFSKEEGLMQSKLM